jgi:hypothetical protein
MPQWSAINAAGSLKSQPVTIANGQSVSGVIDLEDLSLVGLVMPAAWTAASLTLEGSYDGTNFFSVYDESQEVSLTSPSASRWIMLSPSKYANLRYLKLRSGTSGGPVNQGQDSTITLIARQL